MLDAGGRPSKVQLTWAGEFLFGLRVPIKKLEIVDLKISVLRWNSSVSSDSTGVPFSYFLSAAAEAIPPSAN